MSARRFGMAMLLALLALPAWAQQHKQGLVMQPMILRPDVDLVSPVDGAQFVTGQTVALDAVGYPMNGEIVEMDVYLDGALYASTTTSAEITANWTATLGTHTVYAKATDEALSRTSPTVTITVVPNVMPSVSLTAPANGAAYTIGASVPMAATASDSDGSINRVEFWVDSVKKTQDTSSPYAYTWTATAGSHSVLAKAIDNANGTTSTAAITIHGVPAVPTLTLPTTSADGSYTASWTTSTGATHYELTEKIGSGSWGSPIQDTSATSWATSGKAVGSYSYRVRACAGTGTTNCSAYSATKTVTVTLITAPEVPTLDLPAADPDGTYDVEWSSSDGPERYELDEQVGNGTWNIGVYVGSGLIKQYSGKAPQVYGYRVRACNGTTCSANATGTITVVGTPVITPLSSPDADGDYTLTWSAVPGTPWYRVYESTDGGVTWGGNIQNSPATSMPFQGKPDGSYTYKVRACEGSVCGSYSAVAGITVGGSDPTPATPQLTVAPATSYDGTYVVSWSSSSGATHYELSEKVGNGTWSLPIDVGAGTHWSPGSSKPVGSYSYQVSACPGSGTCSEYSAPVTVTVSPLGAPVLTVPGTSPDGSYRVEWTASTGATHYELSEKVGTGGWNVVQDTSALGKDMSGKANGDYGYQVRACAGAVGDTTHCSTYSTPETVTVALSGNAPPTVQLTAPSTSDTIAAGQSITVSATANDTDGTIASVEFSIDGILYFTDTDSPYGTTWTAGAGSHTISAVAVDDDGSSSAADTVTLSIPVPPPTSITRVYTYNSNQELCRVEEPETGVTLMGYDAAGNLSWSASGLPAGTACSSTGNGVDRKVTRTYDARNRISTLTFPDGNGNQEWHYTADGLPASVTTWNDALATSVTNTYAYNERRLLTQEQQQTASTTLTVDYGYDANGFLSTLTYPDALPAGNRTIAYAPNALGQATQAGTYATDVTYYPNGAIAGFTYGNGIKHEMTQNARGLPEASWDHNGPSSAVLQDEYTYDPVGNVVAITDAAPGRNQHGNREMYYDDLNRLTRVEAPAMFGVATYAYDAYDNLTHVAVTGGSQIRDQDYCYDEHNRLTNVMTGGCTGGTSVIGLGYDVQGNLANKNGATFTFDYGNRLRAATAVAPDVETYAYDAQGRRIRSSRSAGTIDSLYSQSGQLLFQKDGRGSKRRQYVYLGGSLVAEVDLPLTGSTATVAYQHTDALGTPVAITNASKAVTERRDYEPYGYQITPALKDGVNYTGHVADAATGMIYMQQRYYDPLCGCFVSTDPVGALSGPFNRYWYAVANPYRFNDPDGRAENEVYLISGGGEWKSGQTVSAGKRPRSGTATASSTGAPTEQINQWMGSKDARDRLKAAFAAIKFFKIRTHGEVLKVTSKYPGDSGTHGENQVVLYGGAFSSWSWLGTTLGHEFEGHYDNLGYSAPEIAESEVRAYRYSLDSVNRFGDSPGEVNKLEASYESWLKEYESWKQYQGEW